MCICWSRYRRSCRCRASWDIWKVRVARCYMSNSANWNTSIEAESSGAEGTMWIRQERTQAELQSTSRTNWKRINWANNSRWVKLARLRVASNSPCAAGRSYYTFDVSARIRGLCPHVKYPRLCRGIFIVIYRKKTAGIRKSEKAESSRRKKRCILENIMI